MTNYNTTQAQNAKISIIMPVYNAEKFLREAMDSLCKQTMNDIEILCVNDGSSDNSLNILREYEKKDQRIIVFSQPNSGPATARNLALSFANSPFVMFCDADDSYEPTMCEEMYEAINGSSYDFVMCDANIIETDKNTRSPGAVDYNRLKTFGHISLDSSSKTLIQTILWNKIFKMDIIRKYDISFPNGFEMDDDAFICLYLACSNSTFGLNRKLYNYRLSSNSIVANYYSNHVNKLLHIAHAYSFSISHLIFFNLFDVNNKPWMVKRINNKLKWTLEMLNKKDSIEFMKQFKKDVLKYFSLQDLKYYPLLSLCKNGKFKEAFYMFKGIKYSSFAGFITKKKSKQKVSVAFWGIQIFKKVKKPSVVKYYLFGVQFRQKRRINDILASDIKGFIKSISNETANRTVRAVTACALHQKTFNGYQNKYNGKEVALVGGGPTVNSFSVLKDLVYVGLNRAFLREDIIFDYIFAADKIGIEKFIPELVEYSKYCKVFMGDINCGKDFQIPESTVLKIHNAFRYKTDNGIRPCRFTLDIETEPLGAFHSVAFQAIQFILYTNPKRIYLIGIDCGNGGKHFGGAEHNVAERNEDINKLQQVQIKEWKKLKEFADMYYPETEIVSVNPVGLTGLFRDMYTEAYLNEHPEIARNAVEILKEN